jgi:hypothetical protein
VTLTVGSPRKPSTRPSVAPATRARTLSSGSPVTRATRATCSAAYSGEMCGSSPDADAVTASGGTSAGSTPSRAAISSRRLVTASSSLASKPPLFEPPDVDVSAGPSTSLAEAAGRVWK